jgi:hypothetical protein
MKTRLLSFIAGICFYSIGVAQVNVPLVNPSFELPLGGAKITTLDNNAIPGWFSDTTYTDTGRETNATAPDGAMIGYTSNKDGSVAQVVEPIADVANVVTYVLTFDGKKSYGPGTVCQVYTLFSVYSGNDRTSRVIVDSQAVDITSNWQTFTHVVQFDANSVYAGDSLVIEYNGYGDEASPNTWVNVDNFRLKKYNGVYTGDNIVALENPSFELPAGGAKITNLDNNAIPGWFSDTSYTDTGREANATAPDGAMIGYTSNKDGSVAHLVELIADVPQAVTYVLTFDGKKSYSPGTVCQVYTLFSVYSGNDRTSRVIVDSQAVDITSNWQTFTHAVQFDGNSVYAGDSLVIEYNGYGDEASPNTWVNVDNFKLSKYTEGETILYPIANILDGANHIDANDFSGDISASWDADSFYMQLAIVDDSIVNVGTYYDVDNIEIYIDMDNSKNIHWPRNGAWVASLDPTYDTNDYMLRLIPDVDFAVNNTARPSITDGYRQVYSKTANGYNFELNIAWNALLEGFVPEVGKVIGFDINASDNDNNPFYRDQITLNSTTLQIFNDPSLWANVQFGPYGQFIGMPSDNMPPTIPTGLDSVLTDTNKINLKWTPSTDQASAVMKYTVYKGDVLLATVYPANATTATYNAIGLTPETAYTFKVAAIDNYGNESAASSSKTITTKAVPPVIPGVNNVELSFNKIYPNPSTGIFNIETSDKGLVSFNVYNVTGELIKSGNFTDSYRLDLSNYSNGMYILNVKSAQKSEVIKLIIK